MTDNPSIANAQKFINDNDFRRAIFELTDRLKQFPNDIEATLLRAESYLNMGLYKDAISDYDKAFSNPDTIATLGMLYYYCIALYKSGQYEKAINQLESVLACEENFTEANKTMGELMMLTNEFERAIFYLSKVVESTPSDVNSIYMRAQCYYKVQEFTEAIEDYQNTISLYDHPDVRLSFGICLFNSGRKEEGVLQLEIAKKGGNAEADKYLEMVKSM